MAQLPLRVRLGYATGHVLNDLTATLWFTYYLVYTHEVIQFPDALAGSLLLLGQVVDAISTPIIGLASDALDRGLCGYGKRKSWHLLGSVCVILSCPFLYLKCLPCDDQTAQWLRLAYYVPAISLFQFGWAAVQTAHLAMIPELSADSSERTELGAWRNAMTVFSSVVVYALAFVFLSLEKDHPLGPCNATTTSPLVTSSEHYGCHELLPTFESENFRNGSASVTPSDAPAFANLTITSVAIGIVFTVVFHFLVPEGKLQRSLTTGTRCNGNCGTNPRVNVVNESPSDEDEPLINDTDSSIANQDNLAASVNSTSDEQADVDLLVNHCSEARSVKAPACSVPIVCESCNGNARSARMTWRGWIVEPQFWIVGLLWALTRMLYNLPQVYLPLYILDTLRADKTSIAIVPLVVYVAGFVTSLGMKALNRHAGRKWSYFLGLIAVAAFAIWSYFLAPSGSSTYPQVYAVAVLLGVGTTGLLVTSLGMTADLISTRVESSAFVYGVMSLLDKLSNGATVQVLQSLKPPDSDPRNADFLRMVESFVIGGVAALAFLVLIVLAPQRIGRLRRDVKQQQLQQQVAASSQAETA